MNKKYKDPSTPRYYLLGECAAVIEFCAPISLQIQRRIWSLAEQLQQQPQVVEVIPGMNNLTALLLKPEYADSIIDKMETLWQKSKAIEFMSRRVNIQVNYGGKAGPDLDFVAHHCGMSTKQVIECHTSIEYIVYFIGFQPGFAYLGGLHEQLTTPRRAEPRQNVPKGSVAIGGAQTGIYPIDTPGGWQIIGQTQQILFDPQATSPTLLQPGDTIRFIPNKEGKC